MLAKQRSCGCFHHGTIGGGSSSDIGRRSEPAEPSSDIGRGPEPPCFGGAELLCQLFFGLTETGKARDQKPPLEKPPLEISQEEIADSLTPPLVAFF
jgi:hypothetical protein